MPNNITAPRVPLTDPNTGLVSREWYRFFLTLFELTGAGQNAMSITDLQVGPPADTLNVADILNAVRSLRLDPPPLLPVAQQPQQDPSTGTLVAKVAELAKAVQGLQQGPPATSSQPVMTATSTLDFPNTLAGAASDLAMTVPGVVPGDVVALGIPAVSVPANGSFFGWVSGANTVTVRYTNPDLLTAYDPASGVFRASVTRY